MSFKATQVGMAQRLQDPFWVPPGHTLCCGVTHVVLAPGKGLGDCRAGDCEDLVAPPWVVATCNSFWSGERSSHYLWTERQKHTSEQDLQDINLNQNQTF